MIVLVSLIVLPRGLNTKNSLYTARDTRSSMPPHIHNMGTYGMDKFSYHA